MYGLWPSSKQGSVQLTSHMHNQTVFQLPFVFKWYGPGKDHIFPPIEKMFIIDSKVPRQLFRRRVSCQFFFLKEGTYTLVKVDGRKLPKVGSFFAGP